MGHPSDLLMHDAASPLDRVSPVAPVPLLDTGRRKAGWYALACLYAVFALLWILNNAGVEPTPVQPGGHPGKN